MKVQTYINEGPGMFWKYEPGDKLVPGPSIESLMPSNDDEVMEVAENAWEVGNRMAADLDGQVWPRGVRSLSMADVIVIGETAYTAVSVGWEPISTEDLAWSLDPARQNRNLRMEEALGR